MNRAPSTKKTEPAWLPVVQSQIGSLRYGVVQIVVHDSRVVQVERTEKIRLDSERAFIPITKPKVHQTPGDPNPITE